MASRAVIFDFNRTLFDPTVYALYHGVTQMLEELRSRKEMYLYSRKSWDRSGLLHKLGIDEYFTASYFVEKKTPDNLRLILDEHGLTPGECVIVGDMLSDEICVGSELGLMTVWFRQGFFEGSQALGALCVPDHTVQSIEELRDLLSKI